MKWKNVMIAAGAGALVGYLIANSLKEDVISPEDALKHAKDIFKENGPISGSWIYMRPEELEKNNLTYLVYRGGISRTIDDSTQQYIFYMDAKTGTILEVDTLA